MLSMQIFPVGKLPELRTGIIFVAICFHGACDTKELDGHGGRRFSKMRNPKATEAQIFSVQNHLKPDRPGWICNYKYGMAYYALFSL